MLTKICVNYTNLCRFTQIFTPGGEKDNVVTTSRPMGFLLNFHIGIVQEFCRGRQNFKASVEMYHDYVKFCRIGRILNLLGYRTQKV